MRVKELLTKITKQKSKIAMRAAAELAELKKMCKVDEYVNEDVEKAVYMIIICDS